MSETENEIFECPDCKNKVEKDDEFCPNCGTLFIDDVKCSNHPDSEADGVCIICCLPFCSLCGSENNKHFLCTAHFNYEIYQGMARIYGMLDDTNAQYIKSCLEQAGLHPFIFSRSQPKGGSRLVYTLFEAEGDSGGHLVNEIKVMVPCQEVLNAEKVMKELEIK
jgi:hypothetical protein